jgi:protoheme IX farnesyltransferase
MMTLRTAAFSVETVSVCHRAMDVLALGKPRVVLMVLAVAFVGFYMGSLETLNVMRLMHLMLGVGLAAGGTLALNQYIERREDALMQRTHLRPLPDGRLQPAAALSAGTISVVLGLSYLLLTVNSLAFLATAATAGSYLFWYTPLKRKTALCSVVGAIPGALPPLTGWVAARGTLDPEAWVLFAILFLWQLPHSLGIAWLYRVDYARASFQLLPVVHPDGRSTSRQIVTNCLALLAVGLLPTLMGMAGPVYFIVTCVLGLCFLGFGLEMAYSRSEEAARRLVWASLVHLPLTFLVMALDKIPVS